MSKVVLWEAGPGTLGYHQIVRGERNCSQEQGEGPAIFLPADREIPRKLLYNRVNHPARADCLSGSNLHFAERCPDGPRTASTLNSAFMSRIRLGILTPSSNTALEPLSQAIVSQLPHVSVHFSRFSVVKIDVDRGALDQFQTRKIVEAAKLLADANVHVIGWSGTASGWLGFRTDEDLCAAITSATGGVPATTSVLALNRAIRILSSTQLGLVTPYIDPVQTAIVQNYRSIGIDCCERHLGLSKNTAIAEIDESTLDEMVADVVRRGATVLSTFCTNLRAAQRVTYWEKVHGATVLDTVATVIWEMLLMCDNGHPEQIHGWGKLFQLR